MKKNPEYTKLPRPSKPKGLQGTLIGATRWRLTVISQENSSQDTWNVECRCGVRLVLSRRSFFAARSCGCIKRESLQTRVFVKGKPEFEVGRVLSKEEELTYRIWLGIWTRCSEKNNYLYHDYGGRGIRVSRRWTSFFNFLKDMGVRPSLNHSIERVDVNKGYERTNCIWLLKHLQPRNTRATRRVKLNGEVISLFTLLERYPQFTKEEFKELDCKNVPDISVMIATRLGAEEALKNWVQLHKEKQNE